MIKKTLYVWFNIKYSEHMKIIYSSDIWIDNIFIYMQLLCLQPMCGCNKTLSWGN